MHEGAAYQIEHVINLDCVVATNVEHGHTKVLRIAELTAVPQKSPAGTGHGHLIDVLSDDERKVAYDRLEKIKPLLDQGKFGRADVEQRAREVECSVRTLYRWIKRYRASHDYTTLVPGKGGWRKGASRLTPQVEAIIQEVIDNIYDPSKKAYAHRPAIRVVEEVQGRCLKKGLTTPSEPAIRARIARVTGRRRGKSTATAGHFPGGHYPLHHVQIDHTRVDLVLVDDEHRLPIGRPWITVAIDVYSRMITGMHISLDAPSATSVGLCVAQSVLPKETLLDQWGIEAEWPVWGFPKTVHVDNGPDFRSKSVEHACNKYAMHVEFRRVKRPQDGGHIERLIGTLRLETTTTSGERSAGSTSSRKGVNCGGVDS